MSYYFVTPQLPSVTTAIVPFLAKPVLDGLSLWGLDHLDVISREDPNNQTKQMLVLAGKVALIAVIVLTALVSAYGFWIGASMMFQFLNYHQFFILGCLVLIPPLVLFFSNLYVTALNIDASISATKMAYRHLNGMENPNDFTKPLSLRDWITFSFKSFDPRFSYKLRYPCPECVPEAYGLEKGSHKH